MRKIKKAGGDVTYTICARLRGFSGISGNMGWRGSLLDAQLSDLLRAWDNFLAGDFWGETQCWGQFVRTEILFQNTHRFHEKQKTKQKTVPASHHSASHRKKKKRLPQPLVQCRHTSSSIPFPPPLSLLFPYPWRILLHLVLVAMGTAGMPPPEAVLTELVIMTLLAAVAEAHHTLSVAVGALDRVKDCRGGGDGEEGSDKHRHTRTHAQMDRKKKTQHMHIGSCGCRAGSFLHRGLVSA